ncbi:MAG: hypothetical protein Fur0037_00170 [Planctomycetota bacterium]
MLRIDFHPSRAALKQFAWSALVFLPALGALLRWKFGAPNGVAIGIALVGVALFVIEVLAVPALPARAARAIEIAFPLAAYRLVGAIGIPIGFCVSHILLAAVYWLLLTPIALCMRFAGHDPLARKIDRGAATYWERRRGDREPGSYFGLY